MNNAFTIVAGIWQLAVQLQEAGLVDFATKAVELYRRAREGLNTSEAEELDRLIREAGDDRRQSWAEAEAALDRAAQQ